MNPVHFEWQVAIVCPTFEERIEKNYAEKKRYDMRISHNLIRKKNRSWYEKVHEHRTNTARTVDLILNARHFPKNKTRIRSALN